MLIRNLRRPGDAARAQIAYNDQLRIEIENDNRISKSRQNQKFGIPEPQADPRDLAERIGDANQRRQRAIDNLSSVFTGEQVDRFLPLLDDDTFSFINLYWKDMKTELTKKVESKLMDEFYFKSYLDRYMKTILDQKGLSAPVGTQSSINEIEELLSLFTWKDEGQKVLERLETLDPIASDDFRQLLKTIPDKRRINRILSLPDAERQSVIESISQSWSGVETDPEKWKKVLREPDDFDFYDSAVALYQNMKVAERRTAKDVSSLLDKGTSAPTEVITMKGIPAEEPEKPKAKRGKLTEAFPVVGEAAGEVVEARTMDDTDYMTPDDFLNNTKANQDDYIKLLDKSLNQPLKFQLFGQKDNKKQVSASFYTTTNLKTYDDEGNPQLSDPRQLFSARLRNSDKYVKSQLAQLAKPPEKKAKGIGMKPGRPKSGKGITSTCKEATPRWIELGRYRVNGRLLDEKQLLSVRYQSGTAVPQFPKMIPISDAFHELLTNLFETKKLDKRLLKELDTEEQRSAEALLVKSGVGRGFGIKEITPTNEEQKKIKRFEVVKGSYLAGNNSKDVIHELRSLIIHFVTTGHLSRKEGLRTLVELQ